MTVDGAGDLYPCMRFVGDAAFRLGDVVHGIRHPEVRSVFYQPVDTRDACRSCWARAASTARELSLPASRANLARRRATSSCWMMRLVIVRFASLRSLEHLDDAVVVQLVLPVDLCSFRLRWPVPGSRSQR